jgi:hypothetical protein
MTVAASRADKQATGDQIGQKAGQHRLVLGVAQPQPDRNLGPIGQDRQGDHDTRAGHVEPVDHDHRHVQAGQVPECSGHASMAPVAIRLLAGSSLVGLKICPSTSAAARSAGLEPWA